MNSKRRLMRIYGGELPDMLGILLGIAPRGRMQHPDYQPAHELVVLLCDLIDLPFGIYYGKRCDQIVCMGLEGNIKMHEQMTATASQVRKLVSDAMAPDTDISSFMPFFRLSISNSP